MSLKICSIGDIMLGENVHHFRRSIATRYRGRFQQLISREVSEVVNAADLVIGNLECSLMPDAARYNAPLSRAIYAAPESALDCFNAWRPPLVLNVANNHFGQHGESATTYTTDRLTARGISCVGQSPAPLELAIKGQKVRIWGVSLVQDLNGSGYMKSTAETLLQDLDWGKKSEGELWILTIHWGEEYMTLPSETQTELAQRLAGHGIDLILGHHPHVIQPVRRVAGMPVAYSHGNFLFDQNFSKLTRTGLMLVTETEPLHLRCYALRSKNYRVDSCRGISTEKLEAFCRQHRRPSQPLKMRLGMKFEMLLKGYEVPGAVWAHFFSQLKAKLWGKLNRFYFLL